MTQRHSEEPRANWVSVSLMEEFYAPEEQVNGVVSLSLASFIPQQTLYLLLKGRAETFEIEAAEGVFNRKERRKQVLFDHLFPLFENGLGEFPLGEFDFPFSFKLPPNLPSSFGPSAIPIGKSTYSSKVSYSLKAGFIENGRFMLAGKSALVVKSKTQEVARKDLLDVVARPICCKFLLQNLNLIVKLDSDLVRPDMRVFAQVKHKGVLKNAPDHLRVSLMRSMRLKGSMQTSVQRLADFAINFDLERLSALSHLANNFFCFELKDFNPSLQEPDVDCDLFSIEHYVEFSFKQLLPWVFKDSKIPVRSLGQFKSLVSLPPSKRPASKIMKPIVLTVTNEYLRQLPEH